MTKCLRERDSSLIFTSADESRPTATGRSVISHRSAITPTSSNKHRAAILGLLWAALPRLGGDAAACLHVGRQHAHKGYCVSPSERTTKFFGVEEILLCAPPGSSVRQRGEQVTDLILD